MTRYPYFIVILVAIAICSTSAGYSNPGDGFPVTPNIPELRMQQTLSGSMSVIESFKNIERPKLIRQMLSALDTGHDQFINSIWPRQLRYLIEHYDQKNVVNGKDLFEPIDKHNLNPELKELIHEIIEKEAERPENKKLFPRRLDDNKIGLDPDFVLRLLARITPIINVSDQCFEESNFYLKNLLMSDEHPLWAIKLLDSVGKVPDGLFQNTKSLCQAMLICQVFKNNDQFNSLVNVLESIQIPIGQTRIFGAYQECLSVSHHEARGNESIDIAGGYSLVGLTSTVPPPSLSQPNDEKSIYPSYSGDPHGLARKRALESQYQYDELSQVIEKIIANGGGIAEVLKEESFIETIQRAIVSTAAIGWGHCAPSACSIQDFHNNYEVLYGKLKIQASISIQQTKETQKPEWKDITYLMVVVLGILAALMLIGTIVDVWQQVRPYPTHYVKGETKEDSGIVKILKCFSININGRIILNTDKPGAGHLTCMNGLRSITMTWIALGHMYMFAIEYPVIFGESSPFVTKNRGDCEKVAGGAEGHYDIIQNALPSVDTFFLMGATLVSYLTFQQLEKGRFNIILFYVHRYIRITIPLAFSIGFIAAIAPYLMTGPLFPLYNYMSAEGCEKYGWLNVLYLNIYQDLIKPNTPVCLGQTWYLSTDMQFYWLSPIIILPLWWNWKYGLTWWSIIFATMTGVLGFITKVCRKPPTSIFAAVSFEDYGVDNPYPSYCGKQIFGSDFGPFIRAQVYLIGLLFGWILYKIKGKTIKIPLGLNMVLWQVALVTMGLVVFGLHGLRHDLAQKGFPWVFVFAEDGIYPTSIIYNCFQRVAWSLSLCWIIFACSKGYGGIINDFLSWGGFAVLSRLTFFMYLIHIDLESMFFASLDYPYEYSDLQMSIWFIGLLMMIAGLAFVATLAFEIPFAKLEGMLISALMGAPSKKSKASPPAVPQEMKSKDQPEVKKEPFTDESNKKDSNSFKQQPIQPQDSKEPISNQPMENSEPSKPLDNVTAIEKRTRKQSFVRQMSKKEFFSKGIDASTEDSLPEEYHAKMPNAPSNHELTSDANEIKVLENSSSNFTSFDPNKYKNATKV